MNRLQFRRERLVEALVQQISKIAAETITPTLYEILSNPDLQRLRAQEYITEEERNKFIVTKAKELGITSEDLEKVMDSAYLCVIFLTDYDRVQKEKTKTEEKLNEKTLTFYTVTKRFTEITSQLGGYLIWFKFVNLEKNPHMQFLKMYRIESINWGYFDHEDENDSLKKADERSFKGAVKGFVAYFDLETRKIDDFRLRTGIIEVNGSKVGLASGKREGLYVGQKFLVYENQKSGDKIEERKKGFFYVDKVGDNVSKDELSRGKIVIPGAEPGMQIRELPTTGYYLGIGFGYGTVKVGLAESSFDRVKKRVSIPAIRIKKEINVPINTLNINANYDLGRFTRIPQLFFTAGMDFGNLLFSTLDSSVDGLDSDEPLKVSYFSPYIGFLKKYYIHRFALNFKPLIQFQKLDMESTSSHVDNGAVLSFSSNVGVEFALREDLSVGVGLNIKLYEYGDFDQNRVFISAHLTKNLVNSNFWFKMLHAQPVVGGLVSLMSVYLLGDWITDSISL